MASGEQSDSQTQDQMDSNPKNTILDDSIIYIPVAISDLKTIGEISQNYMIVRNPEKEKVIRQQFSSLFTKINSD